MQTKIDSAITRSLDDLLRINVDAVQAKREVWTRASGLKTFAARYISDTPKVSLVMQGSSTGSSN
jgi:DNA replication ATP-dependent helicase Dna2